MTTDEERFQRADTLPANTPAVSPPMPRTRRWPLVLMAAVTVASVMTAVTVVVYERRGEPRPGTPASERPEPVSSASEATSAKKEPADTSRPNLNQPLMVNVVSSPFTGGDPGSTFCVKWTGTSDGYSRDGKVLMSVPLEQCDAAVVTSTTGEIRGPYGVIYDTPTECFAPGTYAAILDGLWDGISYACLLDREG